MRANGARSGNGRGPNAREAETRVGTRSPSLAPIYYLSFSGDLLLSLMIVASVLVGTRLDAEGWVIGLLGSAYGISYLFATVVLGHVSDKIGRKRSLILGTSGIVVISILFIVLSWNLAFLVAGEMLVGVCNGLFWPTIEAYTSENARPDLHHEKIGNFCISWSVGYMLGPFLASALYGLDPVVSFCIMLVFASSNVIIIVFSIHEQPKQHPVDALGGELANAGRVPVNGCLGDSNSSHGSPRIRPKQGVVENSFEPGELSGVNWEHSLPAGENQNGGTPWLEIFMLVFLTSTYSLTKGFLIGVAPDILKSERYVGLSELETATLLFLFGFARTLTFVFRNRLATSSMSRVILASFLLSSSMLLLLVSSDLLYLAFVLALVGALTGIVYLLTLNKLLELTTRAKGLAAGLFESAIGIGSFASALLGGAALAIGSEHLAYLVIAFVSLAMSVAGLSLRGFSQLARNVNRHARRASSREV